MISDATNQASYSGNASTVTTYAIPFRYDDPSWISATVEDADGVVTVLSSGDFVLGGTGGTGNGTLRTVAAVPATHTLRIYREAPGLQTLDLEPNTPLPAASLEAQLDRLAMSAMDSVKHRTFSTFVNIFTRFLANGWAMLTGKPSTFPPSTHTHPISDVTSLQDELDGKSNVGHTQDWSTVTGKPETYPATSHTHTIPQVDGLTESLAGKSDVGHTQDWGTITGKPSTFPPATHAHASADMTDASSTGEAGKVLKTSEAGTLSLSGNPSDGVILRVLFTPYGGSMPPGMNAVACYYTEAGEFFGVHAKSDNGVGAYGSSNVGMGVAGTSITGTGVKGVSDSGYGGEFFSSDPSKAALFVGAFRQTVFLVANLPTPSSSLEGARAEWHSLKPHGVLLLCGDFRGRHADGRLAEEMVSAFVSTHAAPV